jgi:hypothetical protein
VSKLREIELDDYSSNSYFIGDTLTLATRAPGIDLNPKVIQALRYQHEQAKALNLEIRNELTELDQNYLTCIERFKKHAALIRSKKASIKSISISTAASFNWGNLSIGYQGTDQDLEKVIKAIP